MTADRAAPARTAALAAVAALAVWLAHAAPALAERWDMPLDYPASHYHSVTAAEFAECVTMGTGGAVEIAVHPGGALFAGAEIKRAVETGRAAVGERLLSTHQKESPVFGVDTVPFLAPSFESAEKLWRAAKPVMAEILAGQNLHLLYSVPWPPHGLYFAREINTAADMQGLALRSYNTATARFAELAGMTPENVPVGAAQAEIASASAGHSFKAWENLAYYYPAAAWAPRSHVMVNAAAWAGLSPASHNVINACARLAEYAGVWRAREYTAAARQGLMDVGVRVIFPGEQLQKDLHAIGAVMTDEWRRAAGAQGEVVLDAFKATP
ncbi:MAG: type 2 periplasmic-binding domain-containing protein [Rhodospirillales bacterium]